MVSTPLPSSEPPPRLRMTGARKCFGATVALDGVDLTVRGGEVHALVGENGAGKSTLMKILSGAIRPDAGAMWLDGRPYRPHDPQAARAAGVVMVYQELSLAPHLSVEDNILLGMEPCAWGLVRRREMRQRAAAALARLDHPEIHPSTPVRELAPPARQVVEIARALALGCRVLVLDEPTSSLAQDDVRRLFLHIRRLKEEGLAIIYISHFIEEVKAVADRFSVLRDGAIVASGETARTTAGEIVTQMIGRRLDQLYPRSSRTRGAAVLEVRDLAGMPTPASASFTLHQGEVLGIAGLVGAGRTELLRALFGLAPMRRGEVRIGTHAGSATPRQRWAAGVGFLSEDRKGEGLALGQTVTDNLTLSNLAGFGPAGLVLPSRQDAAGDRLIQQLGIRCQGPRQKVGELSGGNQQKVALARLSHHDVHILLLDEPTRGVDVASKARIYELIDDWAAHGRAVLMVSSHLPELLGVCDRIAVMRRGCLGPARPVGELTEHGLMLEATGAEEAA